MMILEFTDTGTGQPMTPDVGDVGVTSRRFVEHRANDHRVRPPVAPTPPALAAILSRRSRLPRRSLRARGLPGLDSSATERGNINNVGAAQLPQLFQSIRDNSTRNCRPERKRENQTRVIPRYA